MIPPIPLPTDRPVRVRIAPSPTGDPHVGTAYVALFNKAFAASNGGRFVLRIEDTDQTRSTRASEEAIYKSLGWLGLTWHEGPDVGGDYGPYRQSERTEIYREHADKLLAAGRAYRCFATAEELAEMRKSAKSEGRSTSYDRRYRDLPSAEVERRLAAGEPHVIRFKAPLDGVTAFNDALRGEVSIDNSQMDDQVLMKSDGFPTYHLANVVDDHLMEITHVIRAEEWIPSTPKHVRLYEAFGWQPPVFIHLPLLRNADKSKISKRKNPVSLEFYEAVGILPEALVNFLGRMGWSMPDEREKFSYDDMVAEFSFQRMALGGPVFDLEKLDWLNGLYIRELGDDALVERLQSWLLSSGYLARVAPLLRERISRLEDFVPQASFILGRAEATPLELLIPKKKERVEAYRAMKIVVEAVDACRDWRNESIEALLRAQVEATEWKLRDLFMMVRVAVTGQKATPGLFGTMELLGKARCQARLRQALLTLRP